MDRLGAEHLVDFLRGNDLEGHAEHFHVDFEARECVLRHEQLDLLALGIVEGRAHRMQAIEMHLVGRKRAWLPVFAAALSLLRLRRRNLPAFALGVAVGAPQSGVMRILGGWVCRGLAAGFVVFAHAAL